MINQIMAAGICITIRGSILEPIETRISKIETKVKQGKKSVRPPVQKKQWVCSFLSVVSTNNTILTITRLIIKCVHHHHI